MTVILGKLVFIRISPSADAVECGNLWLGLGFFAKRNRSLYPVCNLIILRATCYSGIS
jgi:hypothetical protein